MQMYTKTEGYPHIHRAYKKIYIQKIYNIHEQVDHYK